MSPSYQTNNTTTEKDVLVNPSKMEPSSARTMLKKVGFAMFVGGAVVVGNSYGSPMNTPTTEIEAFLSSVSDLDSAKARIIKRPNFSINVGATCESGYSPITSKWEDCKAAAVALGFSGDSVGFVDYMTHEYNFFGDRPQGCFKSVGNGRVHFNNGPGASGLDGDSIICSIMKPKSCRWACPMANCGRQPWHGECYDRRPTCKAGCDDEEECFDVSPYCEGGCSATWREGTQHCNCTWVCEY